MGSPLKKITKCVRKLCLCVQNLQFMTFIFLHFAPIRWVVQNPFCHLLMDEPIGLFSLVQGEHVTFFLILVDQDG